MLLVYTVPSQENRALYATFGQVRTHLHTPDIVHMVPSRTQMDIPKDVLEQYRAEVKQVRRGTLHSR